MTRIVCISDTHGRHADLVVPEGDILVHAGDLCSHGELHEISVFGRWLARQPHKHKVLIAGNHDFPFERNKCLARDTLDYGLDYAENVHYLQDDGVTLEGLRIWGAPWQPRFHDWAFNLDRGEALAEKWALIPEDTDILVTHGPPAGHLDRTLVDPGPPGGFWNEGHVGCVDLLARLEQLRVRLHVFGHIHEGYGQTPLRRRRSLYPEPVTPATLCVNASICTLDYRPTNPPTVVDLDSAATTD